MEPYGEHDRRLPGEIVEIYRQPDPREVVETYIRPLPGVSRVRTARPLRRKKKGLWIFLAVLAGTAVLAAAAWLLESRRPYQDPFEQYYEDFLPEETGGEITIPTFPTGQGIELPVLREHGGAMTAQEIYRQVNPAVVTVMADLGEHMSVGTGVIFTGGGYILTNYHVVEGGRDCLVALDVGYSYEASYVAGDAENDLAVLKIDETGLPAAEFGDSDLLTVGDKVYAIGNPLGVELRGTLTDGIVSAINRDVEVDGRTMTLIQTNAALNSGNSGGPLINEYGQVVGINVIKMSSEYSNVEGLGFAIPTASMQRIVNDLLAYGEVKPEPVLGVMVHKFSVRLEEALWGLEVVEVTPDSAADKAGVQVGDFITSASGETLYTSQDLLRVRRLHHIGDELDMTVWRDGELLEVTLKLEQSTDDMSAASGGGTFELP
ncbi:S1C family serine protease [uncultured Dysosmobacter sp.]|uniref:S1C family serine protease n=1 Tax=uncultured Dysosmobacter sp. TaxID=2591384 RepID=UPI002611177A|nr:trypsin-like peptidase domain-containing protein [uncultured Dysosmobacter sp.]